MAGAAVGATAFAGEAGAAIPGGSVGDGIAASDRCAIWSGAIGCGLCSLFQASNKRNTETANTIAANKRILSIEVFISRYRIGSAWVPRMASEDSFRRQPSPVRCAMLANSSLGILRASRVKTAAVADPRTQKELVQPDED